MATCPNCGTRSREDPTAMVVEQMLVVRQPLEMLDERTVHADQQLRLGCRCGWHIRGYVKDGDFIGDPQTEVYPTP